MKRFAKQFVLLVCGLVALALFAKEFSLPKAEDAKSYAVRDVHPTEHAAIAADPYVGQKASIFKGNYAEHDLLPIFVVISNDNDTPLELSKMEVQLTTVDQHAKIGPSTDEDIFRRMSRVEKRGDEPRSPLPLPLPRGPKVGVKKEIVSEIDAAQFRARAVEPHTTRAGFMFFDVSGIKDPLAGGELFVTGVRDDNGQELMYFELPLDKAQPMVR
jgi:hypothetical protein